MLTIYLNFNCSDSALTLAISLSHSFSFDCICISKCRKTTNESNCILRVWLSHPLLSPHTSEVIIRFYGISPFSFLIYMRYYNIFVPFICDHIHVIAPYIFWYFWNLFGVSFFLDFVVFFFARNANTQQNQEKSK